jgi:hypothetical protein
VLISVDTLRADHLPAYGSRVVATPAIDALAADGIVFERAYSHVPLTLVCVLPRRPRCGEHVGNVHPVRGACELGECVVAIVKQVPRSRVFGKRLAELLRGPGGGRMCGDTDVHDAATMMGHDDQDEQQPTGPDDQISEVM